MVSRLLCGAAVLLACGLPGLSFAQDEAALDRAYRAARERMLLDLTDPARSFDFVEAAVAVGDIRGAIAALERILLVRPDLTNIRLELGLLYMRAGSPQIAERYLTAVRDAPETPPAMRRRAEEALGEAETSLARHRLSGSLALTGRYETNANAAPAEVRVGGLPFDIADPDERKRDDFSVAALAELEHVYDFGVQEGHALATDLTLFATQYADVEDANIAYAAIDTGPRLNLDLGGTPASVRPYAGVSTLSLEREPYRNTAVVGVEGAARLVPGTFAFGELEARANGFEDSDANPDASDRTGWELDGTLRLSREVAPGLVVSGQLFGSRFEADAAWETYASYGAGLAASYALDNPLDAGLGPARLDAAAFYTRFDYDDPDPVIDPDETQKDDRFSVRLGATLPVSQRLDALLTLDYTDNNSTLPNDTFDNFRVSAGVRYNFSVTP